MQDERNNVVKFQPRPKPPPAPKPKKGPKAYRGGQPAVNWSRVPRAALIILIFLVLMWLVGRLASGITSFGLN